MQKNYTLKEASEYLGIDISGLKKLISEGKLTYRVENKEYTIQETSLLRVKLEMKMNEPPAAGIPYSLLNDKEFINFISDHFKLNLNEIILQLENQQAKIFQGQDKLNNYLSGKLDDLKYTVLTAAKNNLDQEAAKRLEIIMKEALENMIPQLMESIKQSGENGLSQGDIEIITSSVSDIIEQKFEKYSVIAEALRSLEGQSKEQFEKIIEALDKVKQNSELEPSTHEIEEKFDIFIGAIDEKLSLLMGDKSELNQMSRRTAELRSEFDNENFDASSVFVILNEIQKGQKKIQKIMIDLNVNMQKKILENIDDLKSNIPSSSEDIKELIKSLPLMKNILEQKMGEISAIGTAVKELKDKFSIDELDNLVSQLSQFKNFSEKSEAGQKLLSQDKTYIEIKKGIDQLLEKVSASKGTLSQEFSETALISDEAVNKLTAHLETIETTFPQLFQLLEQRFQKIDKSIHKLDSLKGKAGSLSQQMPDTGQLDQKLLQLQEVLNSFQDKFDLKNLFHAFQESMGENMEKIKNHQESFQKALVNLNTNHHKTMIDKLEQLDRLNELIPIRDSVDEITEQMQAFEAIMADINQLVDERLQTLQDIRNNAGGVSASELGSEAQTQLLQKVDELRSILDLVHDRFSPEGLLTHIRGIIEKESESLKQNQEAAQKILVNLNVNSQKWILEKLDEMNGSLDTVKEVREQLGILDNVIPAISDLLNLKLRDLSELREQIKRIESGKSLQEALVVMQKLLDKESKSLRHSIENSQKIIVNLGVNNQKLLMEKMSGIDLSDRAINEIIQRNEELLSAVIGPIEPGKNIARSLSNVSAALMEIKRNLDSDSILNQIDRLLKESAADSTKSFRSSFQLLSTLSESNHNSISSRIDQLLSKIAEVKSVVEPESIVSAVGEVFVEGNEMLKENQIALLNAEMKNHKELMSELNRILDLRNSISSAGSTGDIIPVLENIMSSSFANFKRDLDGANKVLVNLNVNLQKQMVAKIQEIISSQDRQMEIKIDTESLVDTIDYIIENKLNDIKENQESLLSLNLNTQKTLMEKLDKLSRQKGTDSIADDLNSILPLIERIVADKLVEVMESHQKAQSALTGMDPASGKLLSDKLDRIIGEIKKINSLNDINGYLPALKQTLEETFSYMNTLKEDIESLKDNIKLQDPEFFGSKFEEIKNFLISPGRALEALPKIEQNLKQTVNESREVLGALKQRMDYIYQIVKSLYEDKCDPAENYKIQEIFANKLEETRELERQLVNSFHEMQEVFSQGYSSGGSGQFDGIIQALEQTRAEQEQIASKIENLSSLIGQIPTHRTETSKLPELDFRVVEQLKNENTRLRQTNDKLKRENIDIQQQLKSIYSRGGIDTKKFEQIQGSMMEKDRLLEECYREKVVLRENLEKEQRDKYELIQKYETEKKELIDSLALERIQREKDKADLELLRAENRKKKWW